MAAGDYELLLEALRAAARPGRPAPAAMGSYLDKVRGGAWRVVDSDVDDLRAGGLPEDEIFEHTVAAAVEAGLARLDAALRVVS